MKKIYFLLFITICFTVDLLGQCAYNNTLIITTPAPTQPTTINGIKGGDMVRVTGMQKNHTYKFSTCGASWDTRLTLYSSGGGQLLAFNDDACGGVGSEISFSPNYTGDFDLLLDGINLLGFCNNTTLSTTLTIEYVAAPQTSVTIPVVFHLINSSASDSATDQQVYEQLDFINAAFSNSNYNDVPDWFKGMSADSRISFCLAQRDPSGNPTIGITRRKVTNNAFDVDLGTLDNAQHYSQGGIDQWDPTKYLNIWVCNLKNNGQDHLLGIAYIPDFNGNDILDGVLIDYVSFGSSGTALNDRDHGGFCIHEVGHWLNLRHIWGDDCTLWYNQTCLDYGCNGTDYVFDTPNQEAPSTSLLLPIISQNGIFFGQVTDQCTTSDPGIMYNDYMDYGPSDKRLRFFTIGQRDRMRSCLANTRASILNSNGCTPPPTNCPTGATCLSSNTLVSVCSGTFYDAGGTGNYFNNQSFIKTFTPSTTGNKLKFVFTTFNTEHNKDILTLYDGPTMNSPLIGVYSGNLAPFSVEATNPTGAITAKWVSDNTNTNIGWVANISCVSTDYTIPPGNYKYIFLSGLNLNQQSNQLEFLLQGVLAQNGEPTVDIPVEAEKIKKKFKQALAIPEGNQWISLNISPNFVGDATSGVNFQNTDLAKDFFEADVNLKFSSVFKPVVGLTPYTGNYTDWNTLIFQGPFKTQIQALPNLYYPHWGVYSGIHSNNINYSSRGSTKIIINNALMEMHKGILWAELSNDVNNLASNLRSTLLSKIPPYKNQLLQRLDNGVNITTPLVNNSGPAFQQLRNSYRVTAAAYWYKTLVNYSNKPYHSLINSNNLNGIMVNPPYNDAYWNGQALQPLPQLQETYNYYNNTGNGSYTCVGGISMGNYALVDTGAFDLTQNTIDSICFGNRSYTFVDSFVYFYGGVLDYNIADLVGTMQLPTGNHVLGDSLQFNATIFNFGNKNAQQFPVRLYEQYTNAQNQQQTILISQQTISNIDSFSNQSISFAWIPKTYGGKKLILTIDEGNQVIEKKETNNIASDTLFIQNNAPSVTITSPINGTALSNKNITLSGTAYDPRDGYLNYNNLIWTSSIDGFLGNGSFLNLDSLSVGNHTITFSGTNSHGQTAFAYINLYLLRQGFPSAFILSPLDSAILPNNSPVFFSGEASDLDDGLLCNTASWSSSIDGTLGTGCNLSHSLSLGNHTITLTATNSSNNTSTSTMNVSVVDGLPSVYIVQPIPSTSLYQHQLVTLLASATDFPQGNISSLVKWYSNIQGYLGIGQSLSVLLSPGNHILTASIQDNAGSIATAAVSVTIKYTPPVPIIIQPVANQTLNYHDTLTFIGHATDIQDGALHGSNLRWYSTLNGFLGFGDTLKIASLTFGAHTISLKAIDSNGADSTVKVLNIYIDAGQPTCIITQPANGANFFYGNLITLSGTATDPQNGTLTGSSLKWYSDTDGLLGSGNSFSVNTLSAGNQTITLAATDNDGFIGSTKVNFYIEPPHAPGVSIYYPFNNNHFIHGSTVILKASASDYEEGVLNNNRVTWSSSINGSLGTGKTISVSNLTPGTHIISVTAIDTTSLTTTATIQIIIEELKPVAQITSPLSGSIFSQATNIVFTGTATDYEDGILTGSSLQWISDVNGNLGNGNSINTSSLSVGSHLIKFIATDSQNGKDTVTIVVIIQGPHTVLQNQFIGSKDSVVATFGISGGDTITYFTIPQKANVLTSQYSIIGDSVPYSSVEYLFVKRMGSSIVGQVLQSRFGGIYSTGYGGYGTFGNITQSGTGAAFFVAKQKSDGLTQWVKSYPIGSNPIFYNESKGHIAEDAQGNIYAYGSFRWNINLGADSFTNCAAYDAFLMKLDSNGNYIWSKHIYSGSGTGASEDFAANLTIDNSGYIYITGELNNDGLGYIGNYSFPLDGGFSGYIAKLDQNGNVLWERNLGDNRGSAVKVDNNSNVYVCGHSGTAMFDNLSFTSNGGADAFLAKYNQLGNIQWVVGGGGASADEAYDLLIDSLNNIHCVGLTSGNATWGGITISGYGSYDYFISKHDANGSLLNINFGGGIGQDVAYSICPDNDKYYVGGYWQSSNFQSDTLLFTNPIANNSIVVRQNLNGSSLNGFRIINGTTGNVTLHSIHIDPFRNLILGGSLSGMIGNVTLSGGGGFVAKRNHNPSQYPFKAFTDVLSDSNKEWQNSGYFNSIANSNNFASSLNSYLVSYNGSIATIPIQIHSDSAGKVKLKFLNIQYLITDTVKPNFINAKLVPNSLAQNSSFAVRVKVGDNEKVDSVKAVFKNTAYNLTQVNTDSFQVTILSDTVGYFPVFITVSDTNGLKRDTVLYLTVYSTTRDLEALSNNISITPATIFTNDSIHLTCIVKNNSNLTITSAQVSLIIDGVTQQTKTLTLTSLMHAQLNFDWVAKWGQHTIVIKADPNNLIAEANETNNIGTQYISVNDIYAPAILQATATPNPAFVGNSVFFKIKAIDSTGIASVTVNWQSQNVTLTYNSVTTFYEGYVNANTAGTSNAIVTAYDVNGLTSSTGVSIQVLQNLADLKVYSSDILFVPALSGSGNTASIQIKVRNSGSINANNANVILRADGVNIGSQSATILHDSSLIFTFTWQVNCGSHTFLVVLDSANSITETNEANNTASFVHQFCAVVPSYVLNTQAIPSVISLGSSTNIQLSSVPSVTNATVSTVWNNQVIAMPFNSLNSNYAVLITPTQTGLYTLPVVFTDANGLQTATFVQFSVIDSLPDLSVNSFSTIYPAHANANTTFSVSVSNNSLKTISNNLVHLLVDNQVVDSILLAVLNPFDSITVSLSWLSITGTHQVTAAIDFHNQITENNEANNSKTIQLPIQDNQPPVIHFINTTTPIYQGGNTQVSSFVTDNDSVVTVVANFIGSNYPMLYDSVSATWKVTLNTTSSGTFPLTITATDNSSLTFSATTSLLVNSNIPDLEIKAQNITAIHIDSVTNTVTAVIQNIGGGISNNVKVHFAINGILMDSVSQNFTAGQTDTVIFTFNYPAGFYTVSITLDPYNSITESNENNNSATRKIFIPDLTAPPSPVVTVVPSGWSASPSFTVSWNQVFDNSGTVTYEYSVNGSVWTNVGTNLSASVTAVLEGLSYVYVRAKDAFGNVSQPGIGEIKYDNTPPNAPLIAEYHCGSSWTTHESPYLEWLNPGDIGSGIEHFEVSIDNVSPLNIGFNFNHHPVLTSGIHTLKIRAVDYVNHIGNWSNMVTVYIDLDNPACPNIVSPTHPNQNIWYQNDSVVLNWNHPTETSSVTGFFYMLNRDTTYFADQTSYWIGQDSLTLTAIPSMDTSKIRIPDGIWYVHFSSQDTVGHLSSLSCSYRFMIDKTPPFTTALYNDTAQTCNYTFNLHSEDYYSGIANTYYRVNNGSWINDTIVSLQKIGSNIVEFYSVDFAGNNEHIDTIIVYLKNNGLALNLGNDTTVCGSFAVNAPLGYSYLWSNGSTSSFIHLSNSEFLSLQITDSLGCVISDSINVSIISKPVAAFNYSQNKNVVTFTNQSIGASIYNWQFGDGDTSTIFNPSHSFVTDGIYIVSLTALSDSCGSSIYHDTLDIVGTNIINPTLSDGSIFVIPNPTEGVFYLVNNRRSLACLHIYLTNSIGQRISIEGLKGDADNETKFDISSLASGVYNLVLSDEISQKVIRIVKF